MFHVSGFINVLKQQLQSDVTAFLKSGDQVSAEVLRLAIASINNKEKEKRYKVSKEEANLKEEELNKKAELSDDEAISVLFSEIKKRKDAIVLYEKGNRSELADKEKKEIEILQKYLPEQLSQEDLKKLAAESISKTGAISVKDMGKVMADLNPKVKGKADGAILSKIIKELLGT